MWISRFAASVLSLALLLSSTAGLVAHDHAAAAERGAYDCAIDHESEPGAASHSASAELVAGGKPHHHQCVGCHFSSHRFLFKTAPGSVVSLALGREALSKPAPAPGVSVTWTGRTLRGPPVA